MARQFILLTPKRLQALQVHYQHIINNWLSRWFLLDELELNLSAIKASEAACQSQTLNCFTFSEIQKQQIRNAMFGDKLDLAPTNQQIHLFYHRLEHDLQQLILGGNHKQVPQTMYDDCLLLQLKAKTRYGMLELTFAISSDYFPQKLCSISPTTIVNKVSLSHALTTCHINVSAKLQPLKMKLHEVKNLQPGDVITTVHTLSTPVLVQAHNKANFNATLVAQNGKKALSLTAKPLINIQKEGN